MPANLDDPSRRKEDIARSVDFYNEWFLSSAPAAFREARASTSASVEMASPPPMIYANWRPKR